QRSHYLSLVNPPVTPRRPPRPPPRPVPRPPRQPKKPLSERQRRLRHRALPLAALAAGAFIFGAISASGSAEQKMAERFAKDWATRAYTALHKERTAPPPPRSSAADLKSAYEEAQEASTATAIDPGSADPPKTVNGTSVVDVNVGVRTNLFGKVEGKLELPLDNGKVNWDPHLTFPDLLEGERVGRKLTLPQRASIVAKNGAALASGPTDHRSSPLGSDAIDVAGETGTPDAELKPKVEQQGYPGDQETGVSGLELAFNARLAGHPGGQLLAVKEGKPRPAVPAGITGRTLATAHQAPGIPVHTTIDPQIQQATVNALGGQSGGIAVLNARTGDVLALAGSAYSSPQPPGSTFKIITTTAGLEQH